MIQTLGKYSLSPLSLFTVFFAGMLLYPQVSQAIDYDTFEDYATGDIWIGADDVTGGIWGTNNAGGDDWHIVSSPTYEGSRALHSYQSVTQPATTTYNGLQTIHGQIFQVRHSPGIPLNNYYWRLKLEDSGGNLVAGFGYNYSAGGYYINSTGSSTYFGDIDSAWARNPNSFNEWTEIQMAIDLQNNELEGRWISPGTTTDWVSVPIGTSSPYMWEFSEGSNGDVWIDNWGAPSSATTSDITCTNCTYIRSQIPLYDEMHYSTSSISVKADYKVLLSDLQDEDNNVYVETEWHSAKEFIYGHSASTSYAGGFIDQVSLFDTDWYVLNVIDEVSATGTYYVDYTIYERVDPPWWQFWDSSFTKRILAVDSTQFHIFAISDVGSLNLEYQQEQENNILTTWNNCVSNTDLSTDCLLEKLSAGRDAFLHAPPHGYVTRIVEILRATTSATSTYTIDLDFATSSPAFGKTLSLDLEGAIQNSISDLNTQYDGFTGAYDKFMEIWEIIWYVALAFWILKQVLGTFDISFGKNDYQKTGTIPVQDTNGNRSQQGRTYMKRSQFKSYD